ncbi:MAG: M16 family metallopeptidase [bacterium]
MTQIIALLLTSPAYAFIERGEVVARTLPNGLEVLVREDPAQSVVGLQVWVGVGSRDEPKGKEGIAHLFEHMLFKGTKRRGVGEIAGEIESAGGNINAYTSMDHTVYHITVASDFFNVALDVMADAIQNSSFSKEELEREKLVVVEEILRGKDNPGRVFSEKMFETAFSKHPYGRTVIGTKESVMGITRGDMLKFFRNWYVPRNMKVVVVGGIEAEDVLAESGRLFTSAEKRGTRRQEITEPEQKQTRIFRIAKDTDPGRITLAFPIVSLKDPLTPVLDVLAAVLSEGDSSRLPVHLRDRGVVHSAWAYAYTPRDPGLFIIGATLKHENMDTALEGLLAQVTRLQNEPISKDELERAKTQILNEKIFSKERVEGQARELGYLALTLGDIDFYDEYFSRIQAVDAMDIIKVARQVFTPGKATVGFLSREEDQQPDDERIRDLLAKSLFASERVVSSTAGMKVVRSRLPNGITILVREDRRLPLVAFRLGFLGGVRFENERINGAFNLLAGLLTRGTSTRSAEELARLLDGMSASLNGFSGRNSFGLEGQFLSRDIGEVMGLIREVVTEPAFPEKELELIKERVISAISSRKENLTYYAMDLFRSTLFSVHPYRFSSLGTEENIRSLDRDELVKLYERTVQPAGMIITLAGDINVAQAYDLVEKYFSDLAGLKYDPGPLPQEMGRSGVNSVSESREDKEQTHIILGYLGPTLYSADRDPLRVLNAVLAGQGGRLFTELRDRQSLAYSVFSFVAPGIDPGYIVFGIAVSPEREEEAISGILEQIRKIRDEPVSARELLRAGKYLVGSHLIGLQDLSSRVDEVFFPALYGVDLDKALGYPDRIRSVTAQQVQKAAQKYLDPENYTIAVVRGKRSE